MRNGKLRNKRRMSIAYFLLLILVIACGRKGDPVAIIPYDESPVIKRRISDRAKESSIGLAKEEKTGAKEIGSTPPNSPTGLVALYTQKGIILTWDEVMSQGVKIYNIYRSSGDSYKLIGKTVTPAFNDKSVEADAKYYYRITAVGELESLPSEEIEVLTKTR